MTIFTDLRDLVISSELESPDVVRINTIINSLETAYTALKEYIESAGFKHDEKINSVYFDYSNIDPDQVYDITIQARDAAIKEALKSRHNKSDTRKHYSKPIDYNDPASIVILPSGRSKKI